MEENRTYSELMEEAVALKKKGKQEILLGVLFGVVGIVALGANMLIKAKQRKEKRSEGTEFEEVLEEYSETQ